MYILKHLSAKPCLCLVFPKAEMAAQHPSLWSVGWLLIPRHLMSCPSVVLRYPWPVITLKTRENLELPHSLKTKLKWRESMGSNS